MQRRNGLKREGRGKNSSIDFNLVVSHGCKEDHIPIKGARFFIDAERESLIQRPQPGEDGSSDHPLPEILNRLCGFELSHI